MSGFQWSLTPGVAVPSCSRLEESQHNFASIVNKKRKYDDKTRWLISLVFSQVTQVLPERCSVNWVVGASELHSLDDKWKIVFQKEIKND